MPYIDLNTRNQKSSHGNGGAAIRTLEENVDAVIRNIKTVDIEDREGLCNYDISGIVAGSIKPESGWRYRYLNRAYGTFLSAASEFYRRIVGPYEDRCINLHGDIPEYKEE